MKFIVLLLILPLAAGALLYTARNFGGEVATLHTHDKLGRSYRNRVWVAEVESVLWIRAVQPTSVWLDRLINEPVVALERGTERDDYEATPRPDHRSYVNRLMADRYTWAEWILSFAEDREAAVPVRLDVIWE